MDIAPFTKPPVIIGGCGRSGTTLLLAVLGAHPAIFAIPDETQAFCPSAYDPGGGSGAPDEGRGLDREELFLRRLAHLDADAPPDFDRLRQHLGRYSIPASCTRFCEKTPKNVLFFGAILQAFAGRVRLIHLARDGRDVVTSIHPGRDGRYHVPPGQWVAEVGAGLRYLGHEAVLTVRYEDLVQSFEPTIRRVCDFLDEEFTPRLLAWHEHTNVRWHDSWEGGHVQALHAAAVGRWRRPEHAAVVERLMADPQARAYLGRLGYLD